MLLFNFFLQCDASFFSTPKLSWNHLCALVERDCSCDNLMWNFRFFCVGAWSSSKTHKFETLSFGWRLTFPPAAFIAKKKFLTKCHPKKREEKWTTKDDEKLSLYVLKKSCETRARMRGEWNVESWVCIDSILIFFLASSWVARRSLFFCVHCARLIQFAHMTMIPSARVNAITTYRGAHNGLAHSLDENRTRCQEFHLRIELLVCSSSTWSGSVQNNWK